MNSKERPAEAPTYHAVVTALFFMAAVSSAVFSLLPRSLESQMVAVALFWVFIALGAFSFVGGFIGKAARRKGRSFHAFFWLSLLVNPLLMAIVVAAISPTKQLHPEVNLVSQANELERLAGLLSDGAITYEEFVSAKKRLFQD
jgi:hypothetical protein